MKQRVYEGLRGLARLFGADIVRYEDPYRLPLYEQLFDKETLARKPFYNVGAGSFSHPYWTNIDYDSGWYGTGRQIVHHDLLSLQPLPIPDAGAKIVYTSHTIEHVTAEAVAYFFKDAYRALEKGGIFRITTGPDAETDYRAMNNGDEDWFYWDQYWDHPARFPKNFKRPPTSVPLAERYLHHVASQLAPHSIDDAPKINAKELQQLFEAKGFEGTLLHLEGLVRFDPSRPANHISWWTHKRIEDLLRKAGFTNVYRSGYRQSASPLMRRSNLFDSTHPQMSIYVEAIKD